MLSFIETVHYQQGVMPLLHWHQQRFLRTQRENFGQVLYPDLENCILQAPMPEDAQKYKCRVLYSPKGFRVEFILYQPRIITKLLLKPVDQLQYDFKFADRSALNELTEQLSPGEDILIVRNGYLSDSSFTNLAFLNSEGWFTPDTPLLEGVHRQLLLEKGILRPAPIPVEELGRFTKIRLINAMMPWEQSWELPIDTITEGAAS